MHLERSLLRTVIVALVALLIGVLLLVRGGTAESQWLATLATNVGSFVIASVVMAVIFEFWQLRGLLQDIFAQAAIVEQLKRARITGFSTAFYAQDPVPWPRLFADSNRLNILFAYGRTWRNLHDQELRDFVSRPNAVLEVVLPDRESEPVMNEMSLRFGITTVELRSRIDEAENFFRRLGNEGAGTVRVYRFAKALVFTFYRFNNRAVFATYRHRSERGPIVTMLADRGGELYEWLREEWYGIVQQEMDRGITSLVYESNGNTA